MGAVHFIRHWDIYLPSIQTWCSWTMYMQVSGGPQPERNNYGKLLIDNKNPDLTGLLLYERIYDDIWIRQLFCFLTYFVRITITWPSMRPSICSVLFSTSLIFLTTVPNLAFRVEPFTSSDFVNTTVSPECNTAPYASLCRSTVPSLS